MTGSTEWTSALMWLARALLALTALQAEAYQMQIAPSQFAIGAQPYSVNYGYLPDHMFAYASASGSGYVTQYTQSGPVYIRPDNGDTSVVKPVQVTFRMVHTGTGVGCATLVLRSPWTYLFEDCSLSSPRVRTLTLMTNTSYRLETNASVKANGAPLVEYQTEIWWTFEPEAPPDADADGVPDATDNCVNTPNPDQTDTDLDGQGDACDADNDNDGIVDAADNCKFTPNPTQADLDVDGIGDACDADADGDNVLGAVDNCPMVPNADQTNTDGDGQGDDCDADDDNDHVCDVGTAASGCSAGPDNCPTVYNAGQQDLEGDGIGDACDADLDGDGVTNASDNCPVDANVDQNDSDSDGTGDACDADIDNDGVANGADNCPSIANADQADLDHDGQGDACDADVDGDGVPTASDNCPLIANSDQSDFDGDGRGDACDPDVDGDGVANATDQCQLTPVGATASPQNGCSLAQLCPCAGPAGTTVPWKNHGKYVSCVANVANDFVAAGLITQAAKDALVSTAGQSSCGK